MLKMTPRSQLPTIRAGLTDGKQAQVEDLPVTWANLLIGAGRAIGQNMKKKVRKKTLTDAQVREILILCDTKGPFRYQEYYIHRLRKIRKIISDG